MALARTLLGTHFVFCFFEEVAELIVGHTALGKIISDGTADLLEAERRLGRLLDERSDIRRQIGVRSPRFFLKNSFSFRGNWDSKNHVSIVA